MTARAPRPDAVDTAAMVSPRTRGAGATSRDGFRGFDGFRSLIGNEPLLWQRGEILHRVVQAESGRGIR